MLEKFMQENLLFTESFIKIPSKEIYERYLSFCEHYKIPQFGKKRFYKILENLGLERDKNKTSFEGVYLKKCPY